MECIPTGFPSELEGPMAWDGQEYEGCPEKYIEELSDDEISYIDAAIAEFKNLGLASGFINRQTFPLPASLSTKLRHINYILNSDRGFHVLRGIVPSRYREEDQIILFAGVASHVASDRAGHIDHIRHERDDEARGESLRPTELPVSMDFHTDADAGNILALFMEHGGLSGGEQYLSSFWRAYNVLAKDHPEVLLDLARDWHWEKPDLDHGGEGKKVLRRAIMGQVDGKPEVNFGRSFVAGHPKYPLSPTAPPLTESQEDSLCALMETARRHSFRLDTKVGDILFVNNLSIMHARNAFVDDLEHGNSRHVLRLWLKDQDTSWPIATSLKYQNGHLWNVAPEHQRLCTVTEWEKIPRPIRIKGVGTAMSHD